MKVGTASCQLIITCPRTFRRHLQKILMFQILVAAVSLLLCLSFFFSLPVPLSRKKSFTLTLNYPVLSMPSRIPSDIIRMFSYNTDFSDVQSFLDFHFQPL